MGESERTTLRPRGQRHSPPDVRPPHSRAALAQLLLLRPEMQARVVAPTFDELLEVLGSAGGSDRVAPWLAYLRRRYVHP